MLLVLLILLLRSNALRYAGHDVVAVFLETILSLYMATMLDSQDIHRLETSVDSHRSRDVLVDCIEP